MEGALTLIFGKSETSKDIKKMILIPLKHLQKLCWFSKLGGGNEKQNRSSYSLAVQ